jgi:hypothetical protein
MILEWVASGVTPDEILRRHPHLTAADVEQALGYAASAARNDPAWKQVGMILAYTPDEWELDEPEQPRRSRKGSRRVAAG